MATGLIALLDDVAAIAKVAAASLDDVAGQAAKAGAKSAGVVIDDTAVAPRYVVGFTAERELPIVFKIAVGSLKNKLLLLLPAALLLSLLAPWAITPLLMGGGLYLCYEGAEKTFEALFPHKAHEHEAKVGQAPRDPALLEARKVAGAIRTDFILSAEIMAIALATVPDASLSTQAIVLAVVGFGITLGVYGVVALIVKADDIGLALAANGSPTRAGAAMRAFGRGLVDVMPGFLKLLAGVGTAAMVWVGGGIVIHGLEEFGAGALAHHLHDLAVAVGHAAPAGPGFVEWLVTAAGSGVFGLLAGGLMIPLVGKVIAPLWRVIAGRHAAKSEYK
jgi:predicted DNA repair protein MutK